MRGNLDLKLAWQTALQVRTCPPDSVFADLSDQKLQAHLKMCPFCAQRSPQVQNFWNDNLSKTKQTQLPNDLQPGQIWSIQPHLAGWGPKDRYYQPPLVLVLQKQNNTVLVVQTYWDKALMGPDDLDLGSLGFAETWNSYHLQNKDLKRCVGKVNQRQLEHILNKVKQDFQAINPNSVLYFFRQLEIEVGSFFAQKSIEDLLQTDSWKQAKLIELCKKKYNLDLSREQDVYYSLSKVKLPMEDQALAASDQQYVEGTYLLDKKDDLELSKVLMEITYQAIDQKQMIIGGKITSKLPLVDNVYAWWESEQSPPIVAEQRDFEPENQFVRLIFKHNDPQIFQKGKLDFLLVGHE